MSQPTYSYLPNECNIPDFTDLQHPQIVLVAAKTFIGELTPALSTWNERQLFLNLVRITDRAIVDFGLASLALQDYIAFRYEGRISTLFTAISHVESGVNALARCTRYANALKSIKEAPPIQNKKLPSRTVQFRIRNLRNAIEHTDGSLADNKIRPDTLAMLHVLMIEPN
ncbi:hypothetical protein [Nocardia salmonicida]|uniref:hypothetical protein n=1 Tax=Nocardia salmonicida TaxID=53431 RepID=UPI0012F4F562|nr:hypothetical protein [Nocardia salmonicida]